MYGGSGWDWKNDPAHHIEEDEEMCPCDFCDEAGEPYIGGRILCLNHADQAGRNGYR